MPRSQRRYAGKAGWVQQFRALLAMDVDGASLGFFRICFGSVMLAHAVKYLLPQGGTSLKEFLYDSAQFNFTYPGFHWVQPLPEPWWTGIFVLMGISAAGVALGLFYRVSAATLFLTYSYIFLSEAAKYNNHYYLMCLLAFLLIFTPADRRLSLAGIRNRRREGPSSELQVPFWAVFILRAQLFLVYFFGGIAKINADWLTGIPMLGKGREILAFWAPGVETPIDPIHVGLFIAWFGLLFDLLIGFLLVVRRTRMLALLLVAAFHVSNHFLFPIGLFPLMALTTTLIFCDVDWPTQFWNRCKSFVSFQQRYVPTFNFADWPAIRDYVLGWSDVNERNCTKKTHQVSGAVFGFIACFFFVQVTVPFRHLLIRGDANWTEESQDFSWRMMLRAKDASHVIYHLADDEMLVQDSAGNTRVDWGRAPPNSDKLLFVPVNSGRFNWSHHPGLTMTFEPAVGLRAVYRLSPGEDSKRVASSLAAQWKQITDRDVSVDESLSLKDAVQKLNAVSVNAPAHVVASLQRIELLQGNIDQAESFQREQLLANLAEEIDFLAHEAGDAKIRNVVQRLQPFSLQAATPKDTRFLIVQDPVLTDSGAVSSGLSSNRELLVWLDLGRLRPSDWQRLPTWFLTFEDRDIKIVWNYSGELNSIQKRRFSTSPWMIRQYAIAIADRWEAETRRRPEVYVTSNVMLNFRLPQALIDPTINLDESSYSLVKHNDWILPLGHDAGTAVRMASETPRDPEAIER